MVLNWRAQWIHLLDQFRKSIHNTCSSNNSFISKVCSSISRFADLFVHSKIKRKRRIKIWKDLSNQNLLIEMTKRILLQHVRTWNSWNSSDKIYSSISKFIHIGIYRERGGNFTRRRQFIVDSFGNFFINIY